ncbi:MAG: flagellar filament capping protein FliD [Planctomycetaceae bacterium]|jgi:flagellar hook-associated protein 2|nr:flagellar filament capping protein FliD [Planctomycetaceae bacterium]
MGSIQLGTGLISGMDIAGTVDKLIELDSGILNNLKARKEKFLAQQTFFAEMTTIFMTSNYMIKNLKNVTVFDRRDVASSNDSLLGVARNGNPPAGTHTFTPVRTATSHQLMTSGVKSATEALGVSGNITARYGRNLETNFELNNLNGGDGFQRGQIRITDRNGDKATIDLRAAVTMQDVLNAINNNTDISVHAEVDGDSLKLTDLTGQTTGNLIVQEVAGGTTAASLGLSGINTAEQSVVGTSIVKLGTNLNLSALHDGNGFECNSFTEDLKITLSDGTEATIDFSQYVAATTKTDESGNTVVDKPSHHIDEVTLGDILSKINNNEALKGKLEVTISDDGTHLVWTDKTNAANGGTGTQKLTIAAVNVAAVNVAAVNGSSSLVSLGLVPSSAATSISSDNGTIAGGRIIGGLGSVLLSSLDGGAGIVFTLPNDKTAFEIKVNDSKDSYDENSGKTLVFTKDDVIGIDTLDQYISLVNKKFKENNVDLEMQLNNSKTGLEIKNTSGTGTNIFFRDSIGDLASKMKLNYPLDSGDDATRDLNLQVVSANTLLSDLNGGKGVDTLGAIKIIDSKGGTGTVTITDDIATVGDLIRAISNSSANVAAEINPAGDGIRIIDNGGGSGQLVVTEGNSYSTLASDLHFLQTSVERNIYGSGVNRYVIDGSMTYNIPITESDSLQSIAEKLNKTGMGISASIFNDGSSTPYRLMVNSGSTGDAAHLTIDLSVLGLTQSDMSEAHDAVLVYGDISSKNSVVITSNQNIITDIVPGINVEIKGSSLSPVTVSTESSSKEIKTSINTYIENINKFLEKYHEATYYDPNDTENAGPLYTDSTARSLYNDLMSMLTSRIETKGGVQSLMQLGIKVTTDDKDTPDNPYDDIRVLEFDEETFDTLYQQNPEGIREFFLNPVTTYDDDGKEIETQAGFAAKYTEMAERYTAVETGSLGFKYSALQSKIDAATDREDFLQARLDAKRLRLYNNFIAMESALAKMQKSMSAIEQIGTTTA